MNATFVNTIFYKRKKFINITKNFILLALLQLFFNYDGFLIQITSRVIGRHVTREVDAMNESL